MMTTAVAYLRVRRMSTCSMGTSSTIWRRTNSPTSTRPTTTRPAVNARLSLEANVESPYSRHTRPTDDSATDSLSNVVRLKSP